MARKVAVMPTLNGVTKKMAEQSAEQKAAVELRSPEIRWTATSVSRPPNVLLESDLTYVNQPVRLMPAGCRPRSCQTQEP